MTGRLRRAFGLAALCTAACSKDAVTPPVLPPGPATQASKNAGDQQTAPAGQPLPVSYAVLVRDQNGTGVPGVTVTWSVTQGGGSVAPDSTVTDATGRARAIHTLGVAPGVNAVRAVVPALADTFSFSSTGTATPALIATVPIPPFYGIHDTFVRDGLAFVCAWDSGVFIFDVGNGIKGGSPGNPVIVSKIRTAGGEVHNAWWFWNPNTNERRYLFVGQEGPGSIGSSSSGDLHVVDVSNLNAPVEVGFFHIAGAGPHNFWMDEQKQILYAAYYNAGVVALDVSGLDTGNLSSRGIDTLDNAYTWGVQLYNGSLYSIDMVAGLSQLSADSGTLAALAGGNNENARYSSDLWVAGGYAYTGTWDHVRRTGLTGSLLKVWQLNGSGAPVAIDSITISGVGAVSDVEVSADGKLLMFSTENANGGLYFYRLTDPAHPTFAAFYPVSTGLHTATFGYINGKVYAFAARNPSGPALMIWDVTTLDQ